MEACDICAVSCFIESMITYVVPTAMSFNLCNVCWNDFSIDDAISGNHDCSPTNRAILDKVVERRELQRKNRELSKRLYEEMRQGRELRKLIKKTAVTERTWWNTPVKDQSPEELKKFQAEMESLRGELLRHLAKLNAASSSSSADAASGSSQGEPSTGMTSK